jgi:hypothetical protein
MASITITIPDAVKDRVLDAFCKQRGYQETVTASDSVTIIPNPESKAAFVKRTLKEVVINDVRQYEMSQASQEASKAASEKVINEISLS